MQLSNVNDLLQLVGAVCIVWITAFLCWALYEIARLVRQANEVVQESREKLSRFERVIALIGERIANASQYLAFIAEGGKQLLSFLHAREEKQEKGRKRVEKSE